MSDRRRVLSLWLPHPATDRLARCAPEVGAADRPLVTFRAERGALRLVAVDPAAARLGLAPGMTLADARALAPGLAAEAADPAAEARLLDRLAAGCRRYTPWTAPDASHPAFPGGGLWLDVTGCAHLFGGEAALARDLLARLASLGFAARAGVADTPGAAWAAARFAASGEAAIVPPGGAAAALAPLPVAALRLSAAALATLARLGLRRVGDLYPLPRAALTARLGAEVCRRLDQALGRGGEREPISPRLPEARYRAWLAPPEPVAEAGVLLALARRLLDRLCLQLAAAGMGARRLWLDLHRADGTTGRAVAGAGRPTHAPDRLHRLLADRLAGVDPGRGIELMVLEAAVVEPLDPIQVALKQIADDAGEAADLVALIDRLNGRLGVEAVRRLYRRAGHIPERSQGRRAAGEPPPPETDAPPPCAAGWGDGPVRPLRLLARPEPIEATAPVPDAPPVLFRWRGRVVRVARASGPERIAPEWWREPPGADLAALTRDYYGVEDADGRRFWLFREGPYGSGTTPRWYLHGLFA